MSGKESTLRLAQSFAANGFTSLTTSYRGDLETKPALEASMLGQAEWPDIESAVRYARQHGADRIVLAGISLGATISLSFMRNSNKSHLVEGLVLVAPILDWRQSIRANVRAARLPSVVANAAMWLMAHRPWSDSLRLTTPVRFETLNFVRAGALSTPTLITHTQGDPVAPYEASRKLHALAPGLVTLVPFEGADHALEWNRDKDTFNQSLTNWLEHPKP